MTPEIGPLNEELIIKKNVMPSAIEAELGGFFLKNVKRRHPYELL